MIFDSRKKNISTSLFSHRKLYLWISKDITKCAGIDWHSEESWGTKKLNNARAISNHLKAFQKCLILGITTLIYNCLLPPSNGRSTLVSIVFINEHWRNPLLPDCCFNCILQSTSEFWICTAIHLKIIIQVHVSEMQSCWSISSLIRMLTLQYTFNQLWTALTLDC